MRLDRYESENYTGHEVSTDDLPELVETDEGWVPTGPVVFDTGTDWRPVAGRVTYQPEVVESTVRRLRGDRAYKMLLEYAVDHGVPFSEFLGWSEDDQDKVLAVLEERLVTCERCHTRREEWFEPHETEPGLMVPTWEHYHVVEDTCPGCELLDRRGEEVRKRNKDGSPPGLRLGLADGPPTDSGSLADGPSSEQIGRSIEDG